jgi:serine/threonine protein kinase
VVESISRQQARGFAGTVAYAAPEQLQEHPRPASDQYALGIVVYEWLSGRLPFRGTLWEVATKHLLAVPSSLCAQLPTLSPAIEQVVFRALRKDPKDRYASIQIFARAFTQASLEAPTRSMMPPPPQTTVTSSRAQPASAPVRTTADSTLPFAEGTARPDSGYAATTSSPLSLVPTFTSGSLAPSTTSSMSAHPNKRALRSKAILGAILLLVLVSSGVGVFLATRPHSPPAGIITEFSVPTPKSVPATITTGPDGNLWFTEVLNSKIGRITPGGQITEFPLDLRRKAFLSASPEVLMAISGLQKMGHSSPDLVVGG